MKKQKFNVTGMTCSACSAHVEKGVSKVDGVDNVSVNLLSNSMLVTYDEAKPTKLPSSRRWKTRATALRFPEQAPKTRRPPPLPPKTTNCAR